MESWEFGCGLLREELASDCVMEMIRDTLGMSLITWCEYKGCEGTIKWEEVALGHKSWQYLPWATTC